MYQLAIHEGAEIEFTRHYQDNSNSVTLTVRCGADGDLERYCRSVEITIFDLPQRETDKLYAAFGKPTYYVEPKPAGTPMEEIPVEAA